MLPDHVHHASALAWLVQGKKGVYQLVVSGHSLAEVYSVLTRLPRTPPIDPPDACNMLKDNVTSCATIVTLNGMDYANLIDDLSHRGIKGGMIYDAIIAKAAELAQIDQLVTLNEAHFHRVWPAGSGKIVSPLSVSPPASSSPGLPHKPTP